MPTSVTPVCRYPGNFFVYTVVVTASADPTRNPSRVLCFTEMAAVKDNALYYFQPRYTAKPAGIDVSAFCTGDTDTGFRLETGSCVTGRGHAALAYVNGGALPVL